MSLKTDIEDYDTWLRTQCDVFESDLVETKRKRMEESAQRFLRATYFRWARTVDELCPALLDRSPQVHAVGDIHIENYGTWRDADGRLVWGVNDFDEAAVMPYTLDPVRLLTSLLLIGKSKTGLPDASAAQAILSGYGDGLGSPRATVLDAPADSWMQPLVASTAEDIGDFWKDIRKTLDGKGKHGGPEKAPGSVRAALKRSLPEGTADIRFAAQHNKGGGGLGRPRYIAVGEWQGAPVAREAKAVVPSGWDWAHQKRNPRKLPPIERMSKGRYRSPDPELVLDDESRSVIRRIAADARKIAIDVETLQTGAAPLVQAMGRELGSIHAASGSAAAITADLARRKTGWLLEAALTMRQAVEEDHARYLDLRKTGKL